MPEPIRSMIASEKFPSTGIFAYHSKLVGKSQNRSEIIWIFPQSAMIASKITEKFGVNLQFVISAMVASLTVGGKALGKEVANNNSTPIVHFVGTFLNKFHK